MYDKTIIQYHVTKIERDGLVGHNENTTYNLKH